MSLGVVDGALAAAYRRCRELHRRHGRTYYLATRLLPPWKRPHVHALYGFTVDDPLLPAVLHTIAVIELDRDDFAAFLHSMAMDLTVTGYADYRELLSYMDGSAGRDRHDDAADPRTHRPGGRP